MPISTLLLKPSGASTSNRQGRSKGESNVAEDWDVFAPLEALVLPGHSVDVMKGLLEHFTEDLKPANLLDRMHVRDIAFGTAMAEFLRRVFPVLYAQTVEEIAGEANAAASAAAGPRQTLPREDRLMALAFRKNLGLFSQVIELQANVLVERDRTASVLKEGRLDELRNQLKSLEGILEASGCAIEADDGD